MTLTIAFDVYGTLIDTHGAQLTIRKLAPDIDSHLFASALRQKQLEYTFRRALMDQYVGFDQCTQEAIDFCCQQFGLNMTERQVAMLMDAYAHLPAFADVRHCLSEIRKLPVKLVAFSNGEPSTIQELLSHASIDNYFDDVLSVAEVRSFKPDPRVYRYLTQTTKTAAKHVYLVSANPFDLIGAMAVGLKTIWCQRSETALYDPWGDRPDHVISSLDSLSKLIRKQV